MDNSYSFASRLTSSPAPRKPGSSLKQMVLIILVVMLIGVLGAGGFWALIREKPELVAGQPLQGIIVDKHSVFSRTSGLCKPVPFVEVECNKERTYHVLELEEGTQVEVDWSPVTLIPTTYRSCEVGDWLERNAAGKITCGVPPR